MKRLLLLMVLIAFPCQLRAGQKQNGETQASGTALKGKKLFFQRCSLCHLGMPIKYQTYGPFLDQTVIARLGDDFAREKIRNGSQVMPGFKYALEPDEIDAIVLFLKTLKRDDVPHGS